MKIYFLLPLILFSRFSLAADALSADQVKAKAITCGACHGQAGVSANPLWPNLAGQKAEYMAKQLRDFKAGKRQNELMSPMAQTLSEADITALSNYFASLSPVTP